MSSDLQTFYRNALPARITALRAACAAFAGGDAGAEADIRQLAHTLRGSGGTYGFPQITAAADATEKAAVEELAAHAEQLIAVLTDVAGGS